MLPQSQRKPTYHAEQKPSDLLGSNGSHDINRIPPSKVYADRAERSTEPVADRLKRLRDGIDASQRDLAKIAGVAASTLAEIETGASYGHDVLPDIFEAIKQEGLRKAAKNIAVVKEIEGVA